MKVAIKEDILKEEDRIGAENRREFLAHGVAAFNLIGSPGSGKTSLIEAAYRELGTELAIGVIEGDLASDKDTVRLWNLGLAALQINTGRGCHLSPQMIREALPEIDLAALDLLIIENVGNLVCPVSFDLGETAKIGLVSVAEGDDKPTKYPLLFRVAEVVVLNKVDLVPHSDFDRKAFYSGLKEINPEVGVIEVSCRTGEGIGEWGEWLRERVSSAAGR